MTSRLTNLSIGTRLAAGFGLIGILLILVVAAGGLMLDRMKARSDTIINERMPRIEATQNLLADVNDIAIGLRNIMLSSEAQDRSLQRAGTVFGQVVATMEEIRASAGKIGEITGVIDGIAFQTNILALSAAVEAARAGEHGRGFAVVAAEVRNLTQRSAAAAREIKDLIGTSSAKVDDGNALVAAAGDTMAEIEQSVGRVTAIIGDITTAALEQSAGIEQINQAIGQMDAVTQQNAALVEQSAAASASMREHAAELAQAVAVFQLADHAGVRADLARLPRPAAAPRLRLAA